MCWVSIPRYTDCTLNVTLTKSQHNETTRLLDVLTRSNCTTRMTVSHTHICALLQRHATHDVCVTTAFR